MGLFDLRQICGEIAVEERGIGRFECILRSIDLGGHLGRYLDRLDRLDRGHRGGLVVREPRLDDLHSLLDLDLLLDVSDNISPGLAWPPAMTTICPLGPSATAPIVSIMRHFRDEVEAMVGGGVRDESAKEVTVG